MGFPPPHPLHLPDLILFFFTFFLHFLKNRSLLILLIHFTLSSSSSLLLFFTCLFDLPKNFTIFSKKIIVLYCIGKITITIVSIGFVNTIQYPILIARPWFSHFSPCGHG